MKVKRKGPEVQSRQRDYIVEFHAFSYYQNQNVFPCFHLWPAYTIPARIKLKATYSKYRETEECKSVLNKLFKFRDTFLSLTAVVPSTDQSTILVALNNN